MCWRFTRHCRSIFDESVASSAEAIRSQDPRLRLPCPSTLIAAQHSGARCRLWGRLVGQFHQPSLRLFSHRNRLQSGRGRTCQARRDKHSACPPNSRSRIYSCTLPVNLSTLSFRLACFTTRTIVLPPFAVYVNSLSPEAMYLSVSTTNTVASPSSITFSEMRKRGASEEAMLTRYKELHSGLHDDTLLLSWFRDQVLHPHETQHTLEEMVPVIMDAGMKLVSTSINRFRRDRLTRKALHRKKENSVKLRNSG